VRAGAIGPLDVELLHGPQIAPPRVDLGRPRLVAKLVAHASKLSCARTRSGGWYDARVSRSARCSALLAIAAALGCSAAPATELVVLVRTDPTLPTPSMIVLEIVDPDGEHHTVDIDPADLAGTEPTLGLRHRGGALGPLSVEARGLVGTMVVLDRAVTTFVPGERRLLLLELKDACLGVPCPDAATTCRDGACVSADRPGASLPVFTGNEIRVDGDACVFSANCFFVEHCVDAAGGGRCTSDGPSSAGEPCTDDAECASGACPGVAGFQRCAEVCSETSECSGGEVCVANALSGSDGACVPVDESPCTACDDARSACIVVRGATAVCAMGPLCSYGSSCAVGETCALVAESAGGQAACTASGACTRDEMSLDVSGTERCTDKTPCEIADPFCATDCPECLPGVAFGVDALRAGALGVCVRSL
jgi:hypothetical protein